MLWRVVAGPWKPLAQVANAAAAEFSMNSLRFMTALVDLELSLPRLRRSTEITGQNQHGDTETRGSLPAATKKKRSIGIFRHDVCTTTASRRMTDGALPDSAF